MRAVPDGDGRALRLCITPARTFALLGTIAALLSAAYVVGMVLRFGFGHDDVFGLLRLFDLNGEQNVPSFYSAVLLLTCAALLAVATAVARRQRSGGVAMWTVLTAGFLFMSVDEAARIHEMLIDPVRDALGLSGALAFAWVVPYGLVVVLVAVGSLRFLARLPRDIAVRFVAAGAIYVGGALGVELVEAARFGPLAPPSVPLHLAFLLEESMEMFGAAYFAAAVVRHLQQRGVTLALAFGEASGHAQPQAEPVQRPAAGDRLERVLDADSVARRRDAERQR